MPSEYAADIATIKANTNNIIKSLDALTEKVGNEQKEREELGNRVTRLEERLSLWQIGQAAWTTLASVLAAAFGRSN